MFSRTVCCFVILYSYVNIVSSITSSTNSLSQTAGEYHSSQNEKLHKFFTSPKLEKTRTTVKTVRQAAAAIVNEDFDIPTDINKYENSTEVSQLIENEGSGTDDFKDGADKTTELEPVTINTPSTQSTTNAMKSSTVSPEIKLTTITDGEGSGDDILLFTTELTTKSDITSEDTIQKIIPDICLNRTCNANDLSLYILEDHTTIAEGTNFTLFCKGNSSNHMLYWYKSNGSIYFLQTFGVVEELNLNVPDAKPAHSGKYMCVRWVDKQTCCNLETVLTVYELPLYKYHLIIIGLIAVVCLILCIILSVRQGMSLKIYTRQFVEKHGNVKKQQQLL